ncbi:MAG: DUF58 domain-containing protein [Candidatus Delongbacteria bacterium]|nr:DUF58 domain-containing protein [Candidatus Delongbacteria bacterium]
MIPKEILKKVQQIEIRTRALVNDVFSGEYHSVFKGRGMEFAEVRSYNYGDDIRTIDWNVTARMGSPYVKIHEEERELTLMLLVDASSSGEFGSFQQLKGEIAVELCSLLAFSAIKNNDKVGLIIFTDQVEKYVPPKKGKQHVLRLIRELLYFQPKDRMTDLRTALEFMNKILKRKAVVFLVSDFISSNFERPLKIAANKHDLVALTIRDPRELELPDVGIIELEDAETGEEIILDTSIPIVRQMFSQQSQNELDDLTRFFKKNDIDFIDIRSDRPYIPILINFFRKRAKKFR